MASNVAENLELAEKYMDELKNDEALEVINNIEEEHELNEDERLSNLLLKIQVLINKGDYEYAQNISSDLLSKLDFSEKSSNETQLKQIKVISLNSNVLCRLGMFNESFKMIERGKAILSKITSDSPLFVNAKLNLIFEEAFTYSDQGNLSKAIDLLNESLVLSEKINNKKFSGVIHNLFGFTYLLMGKIDLAFEHFHKCISICKEVGPKITLCHAQSNIGDLHISRGELDLALENALEVSKFYKEIGNKYLLGTNFNTLGKINRLKGEIETALENYENSLKLFKEVGNNLNTSESLYHLTILTIESGLIEKAQKHLQELKKINDQEENNLIDQRYRLVNALMLESRKRAGDLVNAQEILKQIADEEILENDLTIFAIVTLCKLLLEEIYLFGNESIVTELKHYADELLKIAKAQNSFMLLTECYVLQSRISLIEWNIPKAKELLDQAEQIATERELKKLSHEISKEQASLLKKIATWEKYLSRKISLVEGVELAQLNDIITRIVSSKTSEISKQKEELSDFANQMANDLNRNITNVLDFSEVILNKGYDDFLIDKIIKNAKNMNELLIQSVELADAGLVIDKVDEVDANNLVESVARTHIPSEIVFNHNKLPILICDKNKVNQIFKNLFKNAVIHGQATKTISVTRVDQKEGLDLLVANDGIPIPPEHHNSIFRRGFTTKEGSTGLGLAIVKKLVEAHGWEISLDRTPKTTFRLSIPISLYITEKSDV